MIEETPPSDQPSAKDDLQAEIDAMQAISEALLKLRTGEQRVRVLAHLTSALGLAPNRARDVTAMPPPLPLIASAASSSAGAGVVAGASGSTARYGTVHDLYAAAQPSGEAERALVVGYWFQAVQGAPDFDAQSVNAELRQLGYPIKNITQAFMSLMTRKPQFVIQTRKGGTAQQARKRLKLTTYGIQAVERRIAVARGGGNAEDQFFFE